MIHDDITKRLMECKKKKVSNKPDKTLILFVLLITLIIDKHFTITFI